ncbi:unnamed protein product, partial [marine sediment metagenome]
DELLVGNETSKNLGEKVNLDLFSYDGTLNKRNKIKQYGKRKLQPFFMEDNEIEEFLELIPFWEGKALYSDIISQRLLDCFSISQFFLGCYLKSNLTINVYILFLKIV